jgi:hypothetical protein
MPSWRRVLRVVLLLCSALLSVFCIWMSQADLDDAGTRRADGTSAADVDKTMTRPQLSAGPAAGSCREQDLGRPLPPSAYVLRGSPGGTAEGVRRSSAVPVFEQVRTFPGAVDISKLEEALVAVYSFSLSVGPSAKKKKAAGSPEIVLYAVDGTLLNLLRWGMILNDNDLDVGFHVAGLPVTAAATMDHYYALLRALAAEGLILPLSPRDEAKLHSATGHVKPGRCRHRGQLMQCVLVATGVTVDFFGPETMYSPSRTGLTPADHVLPLVQCRSFQGEFPCPYNYQLVLKRFTLDMKGPGSALEEGANPDEPLAVAGYGATTGRGASKDVWYEFDGCALFPRRAAEHTAGHLESILASQQLLDVCGYPNMGFELEGNRDCLEIARKANVTLVAPPSGDG